MSAFVVNIEEGCAPSQMAKKTPLGYCTEAKSSQPQISVTVTHQKVGILEVFGLITALIVVCAAGTIIVRTGFPPNGPTTSVPTPVETITPEMTQQMAITFEEEKRKDKCVGDNFAACVEKILEEKGLIGGGAVEDNTQDVVHETENPAEKTETPAEEETHDETPKWDDNAHAEPFYDKDGKVLGYYQGDLFLGVDAFYHDDETQTASEDQEDQQSEDTNSEDHQSQDHNDHESENHASEDYESEDNEDHESVDEPQPEESHGPQDYEYYKKKK
ncbi:hypothetical protein PFISCL1PPCAC_4764 [Pristionchus fissidentatus]|uniref:Uncharacterized protein n=1 Tax=Pristionchus fissidentatus TaxID=1538716 RepID=A0AAV5V5A3_9BILA|nr:hypothetical protein PFISCL1PPCAC_4764 [Pristionchus fissidentatus]